MKSIDSKVSRGLNFSRQRIPLNGDDIIVRQIAKRTSDKAIINSRNFQHSQTINITQRRADNFNYERKPVYQFANSVEEAQDPEFHTEINIITKRMYNRGLEYCKLQDAHLLENNVAQPNQEEALNNYLKILPAVKTLSQNLKTEANIILNQIKKFKTSSLEATEKKNQFKSGDSSQAAKKARASKKRAVEKLAKAKKKLSILNSKFENSNLSKKFNKIRNKLLNIPGPKEAAFLKLGFRYTNKKGGSLDGKTSYDVLKSDHVMKIVAGQEIFNFVEIGDSTILNIAKEYQKMRRKEFNLTCRQRSFCHHEINDVENFNGSASRLEFILYPDQIMLMSSYYRAHLVETLIANRELIARDSTTEFLNQRAL